MANDDNSDVNSNAEKNSVKDTGREQAQDSSRSEALDAFSEGQGKAASAERESSTRNEVQKGSLPELNLFDSYRAHMSQSKPEQGDPSNHDHSKHGHKHQRAGDRPGPVLDAKEQGEDASEIVDPNASDRFKQQVDRTNQQVLRQMPEHLRDTMKDVPVGGVKSITHKDGDPINAMHGVDGIKLAEKREGGAPLDTVLKHEYGHEFDMQKGGEQPLSASPEFTKLIDKAIGRNPEMKKHREQDPETFHAEVFADLFASNLGARSQHLNVPYSDKQFSQARDWVKQKMMEGARKK